MSHAKYFFGCIIGVTLYISASAQIPNAGFENWTSGEPNGWVSSNINSIVVNVTQSAVAYSGSSAVRGEVVQFFTGLLGPVLQVGPGARGFAYNQRPVSVTGYYRFFPQGGDRFGVNVILYHGGVNGTAVGIAALAISQGTSSYVQFNAPFAYQTNDTPDTCILQFQIIGPVTGPDYHLGSYFLLDDLAFSGSSAVVRLDGEMPSQFALEQNYPNPFNPTTTIEYSLPKETQVGLEIYNAVGQKVATLVQQEQTAGSYSVPFDASELCSGMYIYKLTTNERSFTKKMLLVR
jgi:hypothetical protein